MKLKIFATILLAGVLGCSTANDLDIRRDTKENPPVVEVVDVGTCDGGVCFWMTKSGSRVIVIRNVKELEAPGGWPQEPGKVTLGSPTSGVVIENFTFIPTNVGMEVKSAASAASAASK